MPVGASLRRMGIFWRNRRHRGVNIIYIMRSCGNPEAGARSGFTGSAVVVGWAKQTFINFEY